MKSILDPSFKYTPSHATDIRKTFRKAQRAMQQTQGEKHTAEVDSVQSSKHWDPVLQCNVHTLPRRNK